MKLERLLKVKHIYWFTKQGNFYEPDWLLSNRETDFVGFCWETKFVETGESKQPGWPCGLEPEYKKIYFVRIGKTF